ncbi:hypothetical protein RJT34_02866 [Clitoria ternatea]|uniref:Late embryogenesis abundant protein LEA-2 subgroup domain-containing protein n=1 Tax=Clitoria ternatea TaxID=43366 RepID=A0AAN9Q176_CLITE
MAQIHNMEQVKPLNPFTSSTHFTTQEDHRDTSQQQKTIRIRKFIRCCGCVTALLLIFIVIIIVLAFTVYNVKEPKVRMNKATLLSGAFANGSSSTTNVTILADVSVKNPNAFTFRYGNATTVVYYDGNGIGGGTTPEGKAKARRTQRFNVTMDIDTKKVLDDPNLKSDLKDQALNISTYTRIDGKVKILNLFMRKVVVEMNCTIQYNITTGLTTNGDDCLGEVDI